MKKCLITGASGFLGRAVADRLRGTYDVIPLGMNGKGEGLVRVDLTDAAAFAKTLRDAAPDLVLHLAAHKDPDYCEDHPAEARALNVEPVRTLRDTLPATTQLIFASSDYVFDGKTPPYKEESARSPINIYGQTKCDAEDILSGRPRTTIVRIPVLVGSGVLLSKSGFIWQIIEPLREKREIILDDVLVRRPIWINDVAAAMEFLAEKEVDGVVHLSGPGGGTRYGWTVDIGKHLDLPTDHLRPSKVVVPRRAARPRDSELATAKIEALGFRAFTPFRNVVTRALDQLSR
jgi:dTDP-4-dehydrorhamnose reductase